MYTPIKEKQFSISIDGLPVGTIHSVNPFQAVRSSLLNLGLYGAFTVLVKRNGFSAYFSDVRLDERKEVHFSQVIFY